MKPINLDPLSDEQIAQVLKSKPSTKTATFAGEARHFYFGGLSYDLAERVGADLDDVIGVVTGAAGAREKLDAMCTLIYVMMAPFDTCPEPALIKLHVGAMGQKEAEAFMQSILPDEMTASDEPAQSVGNAGGDGEADEVPEPVSPQSESTDVTATESAAMTTESSVTTSSASDSTPDAKTSENAPST